MLRNYYQSSVSWVLWCFNFLFLLDQRYQIKRRLDEAVKVYLAKSWLPATEHKQKKYSVLCLTRKYPGNKWTAGSQLPLMESCHLLLLEDVRLFTYQFLKPLNSGICKCSGKDQEFVNSSIIFENIFSLAYRPLLFCQHNLKNISK